MDKKCIVIVDDEEYLISSLVRAFVVRGLNEYELKICQDGYEALDIMSGKKVDLVLLDYKMPNLDGKAVCEKAMQDNLMKTIPILVTSGHLLEQDKMYLRRLGIKHFLDKPYQLDELFSLIKKLT